MGDATEERKTGCFNCKWETPDRCGHACTPPTSASANDGVDAWEPMGSANEALARLDDWRWDDTQETAAAVATLQAAVDLADAVAECERLGLTFTYDGAGWLVTDDLAAASMGSDRFAVADTLPEALAAWEEAQNVERGKALREAVRARKEAHDG